MTYLSQVDFFTEVALGNVPGHSVVSKFGHNPSVGTSLEVISVTSNYRTPTVTTALEAVSDSASDTAGGSGAQQITVVGLDSNWAEVVRTVEMNGTTAVALSTNLIRLYRIFVSRSGTYASQAASSHAGTITIQESGGGATWNQIEHGGVLGDGQSEIGAYTVPSGKKALVYLADFSVDTGKAVDLLFFARENAGDVVAPYAGVMRVKKHFTGLTGEFNLSKSFPIGPYAEKTDFGFFAETSTGTSSVSVSFDIMLIDV